MTAHADYAPRAAELTSAEEKKITRLLKKAAG
jgi:hypothetical protein